jgi:uncharacterized protein (TIGR03083 family)
LTGDSDTLTALARETQALSAVLHELEPTDLARATNCPPWDLQELVVHIGASIRVGDSPFPAAESHEAPHSAADYYRRPERSTSPYRQGNVDRTIELARTVADTSTVQWFDDVADQAIAALEKWHLDQVVVIPGRGAMRLANWVITRVVSVAAHGVDVAITLVRAPWTTPSALKLIRPVFVDLLGSEPPDTLNWDDQTLLITAGGRRVLTEHEKHLLGPLARRFPLFS